MKKMKYIIGLGLSLFLASCTDALDCLLYTSDAADE